VGLKHRTGYAVRMTAAIIEHHAMPKIGLVKKALMGPLATG
jgi:hypothetical protein